MDLGNDMTQPKTIKRRVVILDNNPLSITKYAEEYPENWKKICNSQKQDAENSKFSEPQKGNAKGGVLTEIARKCSGVRNVSTSKVTKVCPDNSSQDSPAQVKINMEMKK